MRTSGDSPREQLEAIEERAGEAVFAEMMRRAKAAGFNPADYLKDAASTAEGLAVAVRRADGAALSAEESSATHVTDDEARPIAQRAIDG